MKTTMSKIHTLISTVLGICAFTATVVAAQAETCYLAEQLTDPQIRAEYVKKIAEAKAAATSRFGATYNYSVTFSTSNNESMVIDSFSYDCILCHDGMNAKYHEIRVSSGQRQPISLVNVLSSHPVGMPYGAAAYENAKLRHMTALNESIALVDGRVGCLSCHNMLNPEPKHLSVSNENSELCLQCHTK